MEPASCISSGGWWMDIGVAFLLGSVAFAITVGTLVTAYKVLRGWRP